MGDIFHHRVNIIYLHWDYNYYSNPMKILENKKNEKKSTLTNSKGGKDEL